MKQFSTEMATFALYPKVVNSRMICTKLANLMIALSGSYYSLNET